MGQGSDTDGARHTLHVALQVSLGPVQLFQQPTGVTLANQAQFGKAHAVRVTVKQPTTNRRLQTLDI